MNELNRLRKQIAELKKIESLHQKAEEQMMRLSALVRDSTDAITVQKLDGTILDWNHGAELIYGWTPLEAIGKNITIIIPKDRYSEKTKMRDRVIRSKTAVSFETKRITKDGRNLDIWLTLGVLINKKGVINAISTIERDITNRKKTEMMLREKSIALEEKNKALKEVLSHIEIEKKHIKEQICANVDNILLPLISKIKMQKASNMKYIELLENSLKEILSTFGLKITNISLKLSPREIEICNMIRSGFSTKEISKTLYIAYKTVELHRNNIRKKLGIVNKKINLAVYLNTDNPPAY